MSYVSNQEPSLPTSYPASIFCTLRIDAEEGRDISIIDILNAFVQTALAISDRPVFILMETRGKLSDILVNITPNVYGPSLTKEKGNMLLYIKLLKALYGLMEAGLMFYQKLRKDPKDQGFKVNPYDQCVGKKVINGAQIIIVWL